MGGVVCRGVRLMRAGFALALVMFLVSIGAQDSAYAAPVATAGDLRARVVTETTLTSAEGRAYRVMISAPEGPAPAGGFPVIYVLDGHAWFGTAVEVARMREYEKLDPAVIVGIGYPRGGFFDETRSYDFTPPGTGGPPTDPPEYGGADRFLVFLNEVVKPAVRAVRPVNATRETLFGHSLGALFALHVLFTAPDSFDVLIAASPSLGFSGKAILKEADAFVARPARAGGPRVLITVGGLEGRPSADLVADYRRFFTANPEARGGLSVDEAIADLFPPPAPDWDKIRETRALAGRLAAVGVPTTFAEFPGEEHMAAAISALNRGIPFALRPAG